MKVSWPFGVALRREASSRLMLRWLKTVVVSDEEKAPVEASGGDREGERERIVADVPKRLDDIGTGVFRRLRDEPGGYPLTGQAVSGMQATRARSAASARNRRRRVPILAGPDHGAVRQGVPRAAEPQGAGYRRGARWRTGS
jgi:hypothetical protein